MSQRELMIVLAHAHICGACRSRLLADPKAVTTGHALSPAEKEILSGLQFADFVTPELLARAAGSSVTALDEYRDQPVVRLRHI